MLQAEGAIDGYSTGLIATYHEGAARFKFYDPIYTITIGYSQEKWGGSWIAIDQEIRWAADDTRSLTGDWRR